MAWEAFVHRDSYVVLKSRIDHKLESERCLNDVEEEMDALKLRLGELEQEKARLMKADANEVHAEALSDAGTNNPMHEAAV